MYKDTGGPRSKPVWGTSDDEDEDKYKDDADQGDAEVSTSRKHLSARFDNTSDIHHTSIIHICNTSDSPRERCNFSFVCLSVCTAHRQTT